MLNYRLIIFQLIIITFQLAAQNIDQLKSSISDTTKTDSITTGSTFFRNDLITSGIIYNEELKKWEIFIPRYSLKSSSSIKSKDFSFNKFSFQPDLYYSENELKSYNESIKILFQQKYRERFKYDLGTIGQILGVSRNIMAYFLAILSLL